VTARRIGDDIDVRRVRALDRALGLLGPAAQARGIAGVERARAA
jgi:hypothetical protein